MKVIQMTMERDLLEQIDSRAKQLGITRSAFARRAFREARARFDEIELEKHHVEGYRKMSTSPQEFRIPEFDHAWGNVTHPAQLQA